MYIRVENWNEHPIKNIPREIQFNIIFVVFLFNVLSGREFFRSEVSSPSKASLLTDTNTMY